MRKEVKEFKRQRLFDIYDARSNPFLTFNTKLDITNIVNYCKVNRNYYATIVYVLLKTANEFDCFKYRKENGKIYKYEKLRANVTQMYNEDDIGFFYCDGKNYKEFISNFISIQDDFIKNHIVQKRQEKREDEIWFSCEPWFEYTSLVTPFDKSITIPQFNWCKFFKEDDKTYTSLMVMIHHGFADGNHMGKFIKRLKENIDNFEEIIK